MTTDEFNKPILDAYYFLRREGGGCGKLANYWEGRLFGAGGQFLLAESNQHTLEEILGDVHACASGQT
jgi:hypothetical protein